MGSRIYVICNACTTGPQICLTAQFVRQPSLKPAQFVRQPSLYPAEIEPAHFVPAKFEPGQD